ncbi:Thiol-disulfide oxidoreductase ResA [compost metagenome]
MNRFFLKSVHPFFVSVRLIKYYTAIRRILSAKPTGRMNLRPFYLMLFLAPFFNVAYAGFVIKGEITGAKYGKAWITRSEDNKVIAGPVEIENGRFTIKGEMEYATSCYLNINRSGVMVLLENTNMTFKGDVNHLTVDLLKGSPLNDLYIKWRLLKPTDLANFIKEQNDNELSGYLVNLYANFPYRRVVEHYALLGNRAKEMHYGRLLKKKIDMMAKTQPGRKVPVFEVLNVNGSKSDLSEYAGKTIVIDFWASWCAPCRREIPHIRELYNKFKDKNVVFLAVSMDSEDKKWKKALEQEKMEWPQVRDEKGFDKDGLRSVFGFDSIPFLVVVNGEGKVAASIDFELKNTLEVEIEKTLKDK